MSIASNIEYIEQDCSRIISSFRESYGYGHDTKFMTKASEDECVSGHKMKIFFDRLNRKTYIARSIESLTQTIKSQRFPIVPLDKVDELISEVEDVLTVHWYACLGSVELSKQLVYVIGKDGKIAHTYVS